MNSKLKNKGDEFNKGLDIKVNGNKNSYRYFFMIMVVLALVSSIITLITPILITFWSSKSRTIGFYELKIVCIVLFISLIIQFVIIYFREKYSLKFNENNFMFYLKKYFMLKYEYIVDNGPTDLLQRIQLLVNSLYEYMTKDYIIFISTFISIAVILIITLIQNIYIFLCLLMILPINYFGFKKINSLLLVKSKILQDSCVGGFQKILSIISNTESIKSMGKFNNLSLHLNEPVHSIFKAMSDINIFAQSSSNLLSTLNEIVKMIILLYITINYSKGNISIYSLIIIPIIIPIYFGNVSKIVNASLNKRDLINAKSKIDEWENNLEKDKGDNVISKIEKIEFKIEELKIKDSLINKNIYGVFKKGDFIKVSGKNGSGKSTLLKVLPRFIDNKSIFFNDINIEEYKIESIRKNIAFISQTPHLINASLKDNLFLEIGENEKDIDKVKNSSLLKNIIEKRGLDYIISEDGSNLSSGEKQKISIFRSLLKNPSVIIIDESLSNIDKESRDEILKDLSYEKDKIIFIISHHDDVDKYINRTINV